MTEQRGYWTIWARKRGMRLWAFNRAVEKQQEAEDHAARLRSNGYETVIKGVWLPR